MPKQLWAPWRLEYVTQADELPGCPICAEAAGDVEETLVYHGGYWGMDKDDAERRAAEMIDVFDLASKADVRTPKLSGGMKRRLLLAKALVHRPRILVLDEPTAGVDIALREMLWTNVRRLNAQGMTIILTTHYLEEAEAMCD